MSDIKKLNEEQLEQVAGGVFYNNDFMKQGGEWMEGVEIDGNVGPVSDMYDQIDIMDVRYDG